MMTNSLRMKSVAKRYRPRYTALGRETVRVLVILHKRRVRHVAKQHLKTGRRRDQDRLDRKITDWDFD